jgi:hypothetical protein
MPRRQVSIYGLSYTLSRFNETKRQPILLRYRSEFESPVMALSGFGMLPALVLPTGCTNSIQSGRTDAPALSRFFAQIPIHIAGVILPR